MTARRRGAVAAPTVAGIATIATLATISPVFSGQGWLLTSVLVVGAVVLSGILLRAVGAAQAYVSLLQLLLAAYVLLLLATQPTMIAGFVPTGASLEQLVALLSEGATTARTQVAPVPSNDGTAALLALLVIPVAVLVDDFAVTGRPALTGIPLLTLFAICAAIVRHPISMWLVAVPLVAYLLLLWLADAEAPPVRRSTAGLSGLLGTGVILTVALALAAGTTTVFRLTDGGLFAVAGTSDRSPNETVARTTDLTGQLTRTEPIPLFKVTTDDPSPYYLRTLVLEEWKDAGWSFSNTQDADVDLQAIPPSPVSNATVTTTATIEVDKYSDIFVPTYYSPVNVQLPGARYDSGMSVVFTDDKGDVAGKTYEVTSRVPRPSEGELAAASTDVPEAVEQNLVVPNDVDPSVIELTQTVVGDAESPWEVAVALDAFFSDPVQGFIYSLEVPDPDGADPLASFLDKRIGFCEQYASAMASMFRIADVPARVVVGYTNGTRDEEDGSYRITTDDAHAWVEAYFGDAGWVSFDPTPIGERGVPLSYVPSDQISSDGGIEPLPDVPADTQPTEQAPAAPSDAVGPAPEAADDAAGESGPAAADIMRWTLIALLAAAVVALPGGLRYTRYRNRLAEAAAGGRRGAVSAWAELAELADSFAAPVSGTLGERAQARQWTDALAGDARELDTIAAAAERAKYGPAEDIPAVDGELAAAREKIRTHVGPRRWWWAASAPRWLRRLLGR